MSTSDEVDQARVHDPLLSSDRATSVEIQYTSQTRTLYLESEVSGSWFIWLLTFSAGISGLLFGYDTGVISSTLVSVGSDLSHRSLTTLDKSLITSCTSLFALIASPLAGVLADKLGRRKIILLADLLFIIGALVQAVAPQVWVMIVGRSLVGLAVGSASLITPLYISELAPSHERGRLVTILCLFITGGQVVAYIIGWLFSTRSSGWRFMVGLGALPAIIQLVVLLPLPETPRWLVQAGSDIEAMDVLIKVFQNDPDRGLISEQILKNIRKEMAEEEQELGHRKDSHLGAQWAQDALQRARELFGTGGNRRALIIAVSLQGLQQFCGFNSLMYFSATIFSILSFSSPTLTSLSVAVTNFIFTLLAFSLIDKIGRRRILLYSIPLMSLALAVCAVAFSSVDWLDMQSNEPRHAGNSSHSMFLPAMILLCLIIYTASYAFGLGNVPWQQSELFPLRVRALGSALATAMNWGSNFVVGLTFLPMMQFLSPGWTFAAYAAVCAIGWVLLWKIYPELSGLSLEDVKGILEDGWGVQKSLSKRRENLGR
ncbi:hypothetical protein ASPZODRAFT_101009 [Penicilliopsis zonata CBS 506.65]|uniref:Major facilitator superfamily (MFS) profile domain-containing protein n=1 Tax=Penicilliopsis zonata CBS 506.65 TaxID=1073090 RepID=A0A1L9SCB7_9EURO|nr:hypothetical protein ASPZODRAFT_101009 [Penicilliopsis zonata CBS 506.65]OJJ44821.1 hypothetical protein ASPZODRAFT_101009 [Penicilliopsis zonata CBS 506.65]